MVGWRFICAGILLMAGLAAIPSGGTAGQEVPAEPASAPAGLAPAVDYLVTEYGLDETAAVEQLEFAAVMEERVPEIHSALGDSYAGAWIENANPGVLFVASTNPAKADDALLSLGVVATVSSATYSQTELNNGFDRLVDILVEGYPDAPQGDSGFIVAVDTQENELDLTLAPYYPTTPELRSIIESFTPQIEVQPSESWMPFEDDDCTSRFNCWPGLRAGIFIRGENPPNDPCTTGYTMRKNGERYTSTASHCAGTPWEHDNIGIGPTVWTQDQGDVDAKVVDIVNKVFWDGRAWIFRPGNHAVEVTSKIHVPDNSLEGVTLCLSAVVIGQDCGELIAHHVSGGNNSHQGMVDNVDGCEGDSGGPWFNDFTHKAYGMHVGSVSGCGGDGRSYFTWTAYFESESGYNVAFVNN